MSTTETRRQRKRRKAANNEDNDSIQDHDTRNLNDNLQPRNNRNNQNDEESMNENDQSETDHHENDRIPDQQLLHDENDDNMDIDFDVNNNNNIQPLNTNSEHSNDNDIDIDMDIDMDTSHNTTEQQSILDDGNVHNIENNNNNNPKQPLLILDENGQIPPRNIPQRMSEAESFNHFLSHTCKLSNDLITMIRGPAIGIRDIDTFLDVLANPSDWKQLEILMQLPLGLKSKFRQNAHALHIRVEADKIRLNTNDLNNNNSNINHTIPDTGNAIVAMAQVLNKAFEKQATNMLLQTKTNNIQQNKFLDQLMQNNSFGLKQANKDRDTMNTGLIAALEVMQTNSHKTIQLRNDKDIKYHFTGNSRQTLPYLINIENFILNNNLTDTDVIYSKIYNSLSMQVQNLFTMNESDRTYAVFKTWLCKTYPPPTDRGPFIKALYNIVHHKNEDPRIVWSRIKFKIKQFNKAIVIINDLNKTAIAKQREIQASEKFQTIYNNGLIVTDTPTPDICLTKLTAAEICHLLLCIFKLNNNCARYHNEGHVNKKFVAYVIKNNPDNYHDWYTLLENIAEKFDKKIEHFTFVPANINATELQIYKYQYMQLQTKDAEKPYKRRKYNNDRKKKQYDQTKLYGTDPRQRNMEKLHRNKKNDNDRLYCDICCRNTTHKTDKCWHHKSPWCLFCKSNNHNSFKCHNRVTNCTNCYGIGHISKHCKNKRVYPINPNPGSTPYRPRQNGYNNNHRTNNGNNKQNNGNSHTVKCWICGGNHLRKDCNNKKTPTNAHNNNSSNNKQNNSYQHYSPLQNNSNNNKSQSNNKKLNNRQKYHLNMMDKLKHLSKDNAKKNGVYACLKDTYAVIDEEHNKQQNNGNPDTTSNPTQWIPNNANGNNNGLNIMVDRSQNRRHVRFENNPHHNNNNNYSPRH